MNSVVQGAEGCEGDALKAIRVFEAHDGVRRVLKAIAFGLDITGEQRCFAGAAYLDGEDTAASHARLMHSMLAGMSEYAEQLGGITWQAAQ